MKIGPVDTHPAATPAATERKASSEPVQAAEPSARVELSSQAALSGSEASRADFDSEKVERIAQAIRDGKFQINAEAIADQLIANAQDLLPKAPH
jgi:negative regulator of flagellin synthesis FlgM